MENITKIDDGDNCLSSCLRQWKRDNSLVLHYNSNHVIALMPEDVAPEGYLTLGDFGEEHFLSSFGSMLNMSDRLNLNEYFWHISMTPETGPLTKEKVKNLSKFAMGCTV